MPRPRLIVISIVAAALAAAVVPAAPAAAASDRASTSSDDHCWVNADTGVAVCADDPVALEAEAARRGAQFDFDGDADAASARSLGGAALLAQSVVARLYDNAGYGGGSLTVTSSSGCSAGISSLGAYGWNDRASSFRAYSGCSAAVFDNVSYSGAAYGYTTAASSLGSMNDRASSIRVAG